MLQSLYSGVSGLRNNQLRMDVIGNNIANINTVGFKAGRVRFAESFSQLLRAASPGSGTTGGTNPMQIGLGSQVAGIDNMFGQGNLETTGLGTDLAMQGDGFFILGDGTTQAYTRDGSFNFDATGRMVDGTGRLVQGFMADASGNIAAGTSLTGIRVPLDTTSPPKATSSAVFHGNLDAGAAAGTTADTTVSVFDSLGNKTTLTLRFTKDASPNKWNVTVTAPATGVTGGTGSVLFNADGSVDAAGTAATFTAPLVITPTPANGASPISIDLSSATASPFAGLTQTAGESNAFVFSQDGYAAGSITHTSIDAQGHVVGSFSNGVSRTLAQVAVARFANDSGLTKDGENSFDESLNSGRALVGAAGSGPFGSISAGALEASNVDLAQQFTDLIVAQRGFQANAKMITTGDEMLTDVVNIKR